MKITVAGKVKEYQDRFKAELSNDLNTANSITVLYDLIKDDTVNGTTKRYLIEDFDKILSLDLIKEDNNIDSELEKYIQDKIEERKIAKQNKDYVQKQLELIYDDFMKYTDYMNEKYYRNGFVDGVQLIKGCSE